MAKSTVPVNFKDDIMNSAMNGKRKYRMINNSDGTISLEDATTYDQVGSNFGASQLNATNQAVNAAADAGKIIDDLDAINNVTKEGYMAGALALKQVNSNLENLSENIGSLIIFREVESQESYTINPNSHFDPVFDIPTIEGYMPILGIYKYNGNETTSTTALVPASIVEILDGTSNIFMFHGANIRSNTITNMTFKAVIMYIKG